MLFVRGSFGNVPTSFSLRGKKPTMSHKKNSDIFPWDIVVLHFTNGNSILNTKLPSKFACIRMGLTHFDTDERKPLTKLRCASAFTNETLGSVECQTTFHSDRDQETFSNPIFSELFTFENGLHNTFHTSDSAKNLHEKSAFVWSVEKAFCYKHYTDKIESMQHPRHTRPVSPCFPLQLQSTQDPSSHLMFFLVEREKLRRVQFFILSQSRISTRLSNISIRYFSVNQIRPSQLSFTKHKTQRFILSNKVFVKYDPCCVNYANVFVHLKGASWLIANPPLILHHETQQILLLIIPPRSSIFPLTANANIGSGLFPPVRGENNSRSLDSLTAQGLHLQFLQTNPT